MASGSSIFSRASTRASVATPLVAPTVKVSSHSWTAALYSAVALSEAASSSTFFLRLSRRAFCASSIPKPNSAASSNRELSQTGPLPSRLTVYGVDGEELPQMEEHPVAFATYILSPKSCVISFAYGVSPQPAHAPENSRSGFLNWLPFTESILNFSMTSFFSGYFWLWSKAAC